jgi:AAA15 family ATPase/GTPase
MIAEFKVSNFFSIRSEQTLSFVASRDNFMDEEYIHTANDNVRLLKIGMIYGSNASGKSNVLKALAYFRRLMTSVPSDKNEKMGWVPFLLDDVSRKGHCMMSMTFYLEGKRYILSVEFDNNRIYEEQLDAYLTNRPTSLYRRTYNKETDSSDVTFSTKAKLSQKSQTIIEGNTINNSTVLAAFGKSNVELSLLNSVYDFFSLGFTDELTPEKSLSDFTKEQLSKDTEGKLKRFLLYMLRASDFNIDNLKLDKANDERGLYFDHIANGENFELPESYESRGTIRFLGMATLLQKLLFASRFVMIDELESSMHYELLSYFIRVFLANSENNSQLLFTTHDINLLNEDYIRRDAVWFTDKGSDAETHLKHLSEMGLHKTMSPYNAYRQGKLINLPFLGSQYLDLNELAK